MDLGSALGALIGAAFIVMGSPGPSTMSLMAVAAAFGPQRAFPYLIGLILGTATVLLAVAAGVVAIMMAAPGLAPVLIGASTVYMLYLAYKIATAPPLAAGAETAGAKKAGAPSLVGGFLLGAANPKAYFAIAAVFAGARLPVEPPLFEAALKSGVLTVMIVIIHVGWLAAGIAMAKLPRDPTMARFSNLLFAAVLVVSTVIAVRGSF